MMRPKAEAKANNLTVLISRMLTEINTNNSFQLFFNALTFTP